MICGFKICILVGREVDISQFFSPQIPPLPSSCPEGWVLWTVSFKSHVPILPFNLAYERNHQELGRQKEKYVWVFISCSLPVRPWSGSFPLFKYIPHPFPLPQWTILESYSSLYLFCYLCFLSLFPFCLWVSKAFFCCYCRILHHL